MKNKYFRLVCKLSTLNPFNKKKIPLLTREYRVLSVLANLVKVERTSTLSFLKIQSYENLSQVETT